MINEVLEQSRELLKKIMECQTRIESIERAKQAVLEGQLSVLLPDGDLIDIPVTEAQMTSIKAQILTELDLTVAEAVYFLSRISAKDTPGEQPEQVKTVPETQAVKDYDLDLVIKELEAGKSLSQITREHYPEHTDSWLYKKLKRDNIDYKAIANRGRFKQQEEINPDDYYVLEEDGRQA